MDKQEKVTTAKRKQSRDTVKITVVRVFGNLDLINLYAEYVAEKIIDKDIIIKKST